MRPRGKTQQRYNEALQILSGTPVKNDNFTKRTNENTKMAVKRRQSCPQTVLHLWDAIAYIRQQKQIPNLDRLSAYIKRVYNLSPIDLERQLNFAVNDELIVVKKSLGCKGSKVGVEQDGYRIPEEIKERDGHDWYCFECHRGGEVIECSTCHRVYHGVCISDDLKSGNFSCSICKSSHEKFVVNLKKAEINTLLSFTSVRLKEKTKELHRIPHPDDEKWRYNFLIYEPMDLVTMEDKMKNNEYTCFGEFYTDAQQIVHNIIVYFGTHNPISYMARQMLGDCEYDLQEIVQCSSCYKMSNSKVDKQWFCLPCSPPHDLVYAKVKGYPYWPAKVIKKYDTWYDVRFFGAHHQRGQVNEAYVKPVSIPFQKLGIKKTASFDRAYKELSLHQRLVAQSLKKPATNGKLPTGKEEEEKDESDTTQDSFSSSKSKTPIPRKRKASTPAVKTPAVKRVATVPLKKNKKFYQESPTSSSPKNNTSEDASIPEDHNFVSSSSQETVSHSTTGVQTDKELLVEESLPEKEINEEPNVKSVLPCECSAKYDRLINDLRVQMGKEHEEDKTKALNEFSERLRVEMENEKQKGVKSAVEKLQIEHKEALRKAEEQRKTEHEVHVAKLVDQHKLEISETKKKQWCYNCEAEAIYHCCWNTSYCSVECQQVHWHKEHKRTCRRKR